MKTFHVFPDPEQQGPEMWESIWAQRWNWEHWSGLPLCLLTVLLWESHFSRAQTLHTSHPLVPSPPGLERCVGILLVTVTEGHCWHWSGERINGPRMLGPQKGVTESNPHPRCPLPWETVVAPRFFSWLNSESTFSQNWCTIPEDQLMLKIMPSTLQR